MPPILSNPPRVRCRFNPVGSATGRNYDRAHAIRKGKKSEKTLFWLVHFNFLLFGYCLAGSNAKPNG